MSKKIPLCRVGVQRDGVTMYPTIGEPFDFSDAEIADMDRLAAATQNEYYRAPVNEEAPAEKKAGKKAAGDGL